MNTTPTLWGLDLAPLFTAIKAVESENGRTSPNLYQISHIYYNDVRRLCRLNRWPEIKLPYEQAIRNDAASQELMFYYFLAYGKHYLKFHPTDKISYQWLARVHNGGPLGWNNHKTLAYWGKVSKAMYGEEDK